MVKSGRGGTLTEFGRRGLCCVPRPSPSLRLSLSLSLSLGGMSLLLLLPMLVVMMGRGRGAPCTAIRGRSKLVIQNKGR